MQSPDSLPWHQWDDLIAAAEWISGAIIAVALRHVPLATKKDKSTHKYQIQIWDIGGDERQLLCEFANPYPLSYVNAAWLPRDWIIAATEWITSSLTTRSPPHVAAVMVVLTVAVV